MSLAAAASFRTPSEQVIDQRLRRLTSDCRRLLEVACDPRSRVRAQGARRRGRNRRSDCSRIDRRGDHSTGARRGANGRPTSLLARARPRHPVRSDSPQAADERRTCGPARSSSVSTRPTRSRTSRSLHITSSKRCRAETPAGRSTTRSAPAITRSRCSRYEEAARLYALALRGLEHAGQEESAEKRCALLVALGDARARAGDEPAAREAFLEAADDRVRAPAFRCFRLKPRSDTGAGSSGPGPTTTSI